MGRSPAGPAPPLEGDALTWESVEAPMNENQEAELPPAFGMEDGSEERRGRFGFLRGGLSLIWILLAVIFSVMRVCGGGES